MDTGAQQNDILGQSDQLHAQHNEPMDMFRKAFAGDADAWSIIQTRYTCLVRHWIGVQQYIDPEDVAQEAWLAFYRHAPQQPSLLQSNSTSRVLAYLRSCVKTALIAIHRREKRHTIVTQLIQDQLTIPTIHIDHMVIQHIAISEHVRQILTSDDERLIFHLRLECGMQPQEIVTTYPDRFPNVCLVYTLIAQIIGHLREDPFLQAMR